ncbi:MAG: isochorismate synthase [Bacteroidota bacterium]
MSRLRTPSTESTPTGRTISPERLHSYEAGAPLVERLAAAVAQASRRARGGVQRVEIPVGPVRPLAWLSAQAEAASLLGDTALYWHGRGDTDAVAALGVADELEGPVAAVLAALDVRAEALRTRAPVSRYYGGLRFDAQAPISEEWTSFGTARFVLPRFELTAGPRSATLACHLVPGDDIDTVFDAIAALRIPAWTRLPLPARHHTLDRPTPNGRADAPGVEGWTDRIAEALDGFEAGRFEKVVLARRATFSFDAPVRPLDLLERLEAATPNCYHFAFRFADDAVGADAATFIGASPERLFHRDGWRVESEAVAGTRPRGLLRGDDARLRDELLGSEKDLREHGYVRDALLDGLRPFTETLDIDAQASEMALANKRHLRSGIRGLLHDGVASTDLLAALHPTPAVGGTPTDTALAFLRDTEPFDRGWYAGPVGWVGVDAAEFAVAIRSGLVQDDTLALYSGAGIVRGSDADAEWAEIEHKLSDFLDVLGLGSGLGDGRASGDGQTDIRVPRLSLG